MVAALRVHRAGSGCTELRTPTPPPARSGKPDANSRWRVPHPGHEYEQRHRAHPAKTPKAAGKAFPVDHGADVAEGSGEHRTQPDTRDRTPNQEHQRIGAAAASITRPGHNKRHREQAPSAHLVRQHPRRNDGRGQGEVEMDAARACVEGLKPSAWVALTRARFAMTGSASWIAPMKPRKSTGNDTARLPMRARPPSPCFISTTLLQRLGFRPWVMRDRHQGLDEVGSHVMQPKSHSAWFPDRV